MAAVSELSVLLLALISNIHAEELIVLREERDSLTFELPEEAGSCLISRSVGEEKLVLWNTSDLWPQNSSVPEDLKQRLVSMADTSSYKINNLTHSDSGLYQEECWTEGNVTHEKHFTVTVCGYIDGTRGENMEDEETKDLPCRGAADHLGVQWLKRDYRYEQKIWARVFGDNTASVMDNERGRYQVVENTSTLRMSNITTADLGEYTCLVMNQQQCVSSHPVQFRLKIEWIYHSVGETAVLQCPDIGFNEEKPPYWETKFHNIDHGQRNYTVGLVDQNHSLVLTSVTLNHTAIYTCNTLTTLKSYVLVVCPKSPPPAVELFSEGEHVTLRCKNLGMNSLWFFKSNRTKGTRFNVDVNKINSNMHRSPDGRWVIPNVSLRDTGEYWCAIFHHDLQCLFSTKTIVKHRDPFGVHSTVTQ